MYIHTFGRQDRPAILLLHPMGLPGETLFGIFREFVPDDYFVIFPDQGGHGKSGGYESVEPGPGLISLAHRGVLFLDELTTDRKSVV